MLGYNSVNYVVVKNVPVVYIKWPVLISQNTNPLPG